MKSFFDDKFFVLGHRGFSEVYPENTMMSFDACASDSGIDGVELDVHLCKSGEVVIAHDSSLKRTAGIDREIEDCTWQELQEIDVGSFKSPEFSNARIPLLEELFSKHGSRFYYDVELKVKSGKLGIELSRKTLALIYKYNLQDHVMVSSFNPFALRVFRILSWRKINTADIFSDSDYVPKFLRHGAGKYISCSTYMKPEFKQLSARFFIINNNSPVITWTVNTEEDAKKMMLLKKKGFNLRGMIGNNPELLAKTVKKG